MSTKKALIHIHLRKCGGTSVRQMVHAGAKQAGWVSVGFTPRFKLSYFRHSKKAKYSYPDHDKVFAVGRHRYGQSVRRGLHARAYETFTICILREPLEAFVSWCNYTEMDQVGPGGETVPFMVSARAKTSNPFLYFLIIEWLEIPWWRALFLSPENRLALVEAQLESCDRIYDVSQIGGIMRDDLSAFGLPVPTKRANTTAQKAARFKSNPYLLDDLTDAQEQWVRDRLSYDVYLWRRFVKDEVDAPRPTGNDGFVTSALRSRFGLAMLKLWRGLLKLGLPQKMSKKSI